MRPVSDIERVVSEFREMKCDKRVKTRFDVSSREEAGRRK